MMKQIAIIIIFFFLNQCIYARGINLVIPKKPTITEKFAAQELQSYLKRITDRRFEINTSRLSGSFNIFVKNYSNEKTIGNEDSYIIKSVDNGIMLSGAGNRGTLYAVYDFLEKLGCRWYYMDSTDEVISSLTVDGIMKIASNLNITEKPDFNYRIFQFQAYQLPPDFNFKEEEYATKLIDWLTKNRFNIFQYGIDNQRSYDLWPDFKKYLFELEKRGMILGVCGHSQFLFMPDSVFKTHKDWWPEKNGKRIHTGQFCISNEAAVNYYVNNIIEFLKENREIKYFSAWLADVYGEPKCVADSLMPDIYLKLSNKIQTEIRKESLNITYNHFNYSAQVKAPKNEKPLFGMPVTFAPWGRDYDDNFFNMSAKNGWEGNNLKEDFVKEFNAWLNICESTNSPFIMHEKYLRQFGLGFLPLPLKTLPGDMKYFKQKVSGFELPMGPMAIQTKAFNLYATSRLMWNSHTDVKELEKDYFEKFYGESAPIMQETYEEVVLAQPNLKYFYDLQRLVRKISPIKKYTLKYKDRDYATNALYHINLAQKYLQEALLHTSNDKITERMGRFEKPLNYLQIEYEGLLSITEAIYHIQKADSSTNSLDLDIELKFAQQHLDVAKKKSDKRQKLIQENDIRYYWDVEGGIPSCVYRDLDIQNLQQIIKNLEKNIIPNIQ